MDHSPTTVQTFRDLVVWSVAHQLTLWVYHRTQRFPREEIYGITSQLRRAAASTCANIVEGSKRQSTPDLCHFLNMAQGSNEEAKYFLLLSKDLGHLTEDQFKEANLLTERVGAMLYNLIASLKRQA